MKRAALGILAVALLAAGGLAGARLVHSQEPSGTPPVAGRAHFLNMEGAADNVFGRAAESFGLEVPATWNRTNGEGARCPSHVLSKKGQRFWCQALLEGELVPVEVELLSSLGFFRVVHVGRNAILEERHHEQLQTEYQENCEYEYPARGLRYHRCMYY